MTLPFEPLHRRHLLSTAARGALTLGAAALGTLALPRLVMPGARAAPPPVPFPQRPPLPPGRLHEWQIVAQEGSARLLGPQGPESRVWTYGDRLMPVHRIRLGDRIRATLQNNLPEHTSIHWHGVRVPNAMDGVQYVTQPPVEPGESFVYDFTPPDTGTFFFHPHCNEPGQVGRGLAGVLIVEGDEPSPSDADIVMVCKDWRLAEDGSWLPFETAQGAARAGTFGTLRAVNALPDFTAEVPAHGDIRLRVLNLDSSRQIVVGVEGAEAWVIATDGNPVMPFRLDKWRFGPAMRVDILVRAPAAGGGFSVLDYFPQQPWPLGRFSAVPSGKSTRDFAPGPLYASDIPHPQLAGALREDFIFSASTGANLGNLPADDPLTAIVMDSLCVGENTFWAINKSVWPGGEHRNLPPPLAELRSGQTYVFTLQNTTPHPHPIHLHGHSFEVLSLSRQELPRFTADTVLLLPRERAEIAFVAREGKWMFHCHVLEHLGTGMMGWLRVA
jgi:FtsP/CotA-like multicopper oxidase with cupredoxin domain